VLEARTVEHLGDRQHLGRRHEAGKWILPEETDRRVHERRHARTLASRFGNVVAATEREVATAVSLGREHGLPVDEPVVVGDRTNLLVHLRPSPVVARVARLFAAERGAATVEAQVALSRHAVAHGAPVAAPADELPPGPHERDGLLITFWRWYDHDEGRELSNDDVGRSLRDVHDALASYRGSLAPYARADELRSILDRLEGAGEDVAVLRRGLEEVQATQLGGQPVHGDAHPGNVLRTPAGVRWTDLEAACVAPREYDLAGLLWMDISRPERPPVAAEAIAEYGDHDPEVLELMLPAYGIFNAVWTVELVRRMPSPRGIEVRDHRVGWWRRRYGLDAQAREM
jgi:hypothetical protein